MSTERERPLMLVLSQVQYDSAMHSLRPTLWKQIEDMCQSLNVRWLIVPPIMQDGLDSILELADGILIAGTDATFEQYYDISHPTIDDIMDNLPECDYVALNMLEYAFEHDIPALGICHGMQLLNVSCGGTLRFAERHNADGAWCERVHDMNIVPAFSDFLGCVEVNAKVNSKHSIACDLLGNGIEMAACTGDDVTEMIYAPSRKFFVGTQWHPEFLMDDEMSRALFAKWESAMSEHARSRDNVQR